MSFARKTRPVAPRPSNGRVVFRRDGDRYITFLEDDRIGFVRRADDGTWNFVDTTMAHSGYTKTRQRAGQLLRRRFEPGGSAGRIS